jgi:hypothetical protein
MDIDTSRIRELLDQRDAIDTELARLFSGISSSPQARGTLTFSAKRMQHVRVSEAEQ